MRTGARSNYQTKAMGVVVISYKTQIQKPLLLFLVLSPLASASCIFLPPGFGMLFPMVP